MPSARRVVVNPSAVRMSRSADVRSKVAVTVSWSQTGPRASFRQGPSESAPQSLKTSASAAERAATRSRAQDRIGHEADVNHGLSSSPQRRHSICSPRPRNSRRSSSVGGKGLVPATTTTTSPVPSHKVARRPRSPSTPTPAAPPRPPPMPPAPPRPPAGTPTAATTPPGPTSPAPPEAPRPGSPSPSAATSPHRSTTPPAPPPKGKPSSPWPTPTATSSPPSPSQPPRHRQPRRPRSPGGPPTTSTAPPPPPTPSTDPSAMAGSAPYNAPPQPPPPASP